MTENTDGDAPEERNPGGDALVTDQELIRRIDTWVAHDIVSPEQAAAMRSFEFGPSEARTPHAPGPVREIFAYIGAALVLTASLVLLGQLWDDISDTGRIAVSVLAAAILVGVGFALERSKETSIRRVGRMCLLLAVAPVGLSAGLVADLAASDETVSVLAGFSVALVVSGGFYRRDRSAPQHVALVASAVGTLLALGDMLAGDSGSWPMGVGVMIFGGGWVAASVRDMVPPRVLGEAVGIGAIGLGSVITVASLGTSGGDGITGLTFCIAVAVVLVSAGVRLDEVTLVVGGVLGLLVYVPWIAAELLGDGLGAPVALLIAGSVLIGAAIYLTRRSRTTA